MAKSLEQILGYVPLTGLIQATTTGIPRLLPSGFYDIIKPTIGDSGRYTQVTGTRTTARRVEYGAPPLRRELKDIAEKDVKLIHTLEEIQLLARIMMLLRNYTNYDLQQKGIDEVNRQAAEFKQRFTNLRTAAALMALTLGKIYFDANGNLLPSSSGAVATIDFGRNTTTNEGSGQAADLSTALVSATWATTSTDIAADLRRIKQTARIRTGYPLRYAFYGEKIPGYLANNTSIQAYFARNAAKNEQFLNTNELPEILDLKWVPAYEHFFEDSGGTNRIIWPTDLVVFTPEPESGWWETMEGTYPVPTTINIVGDLQAANASFKDVQGMFGYGLPCLSPPSSFLAHYGDTFLPVLKVPNATYALDVVP